MLVVDLRLLTKSTASENYEQAGFIPAVSE